MANIFASEGKNYDWEKDPKDRTGGSDRKLSIEKQNAGGQQLKRKFVPPTKSDRNGLNSGAVGSNGGGFNPGRSV